MAAAASYPAGVLVEEHAGLVGAHTRQASWLGPQVLDVRFGCEVCLVLGPDYQHPFINWIGVATDVAYTMALVLLLYYFVRSCVNN